MGRSRFRAYASAGVIAVALAIGLAQFVVAQPEPAAGADAAQSAELLGVFHRFERVYFDATVNLDASLFPTVFYNDPTVKLLPEYRAMIDARRADVGAVLTKLDGVEPVGSDTGYLSAKIAEMLIYSDQVRAWDEVKATAARENRNPSIAELPAGFQPIERRYADEWVDSDTHIHDAIVQGEHATATFSFGTDKKEGTLMHLTFTRVGGQWYVSGSWSSGDA